MNERPPLTSLADQRCHNHVGREAVALCQECGNYFCRECITEHDDRAICAACLRKAVSPSERRGYIVPLTAISQVAAGILVLWLLFYCFGRALLAIPSSFHDGTLWDTSSWLTEDY